MEGGAGLQEDEHICLYFRWSLLKTEKCITFAYVLHGKDNPSLHCRWDNLATIIDQPLPCVIPIHHKEGRHRNVTQFVICFINIDPHPSPHRTPPLHPPPPMHTHPHTQWCGSCPCSTLLYCHLVIVESIFLKGLKSGWQILKTIQFLQVEGRLFFQSWHSKELFFGLLNQKELWGEGSCKQHSEVCVNIVVTW